MPNPTTDEMAREVAIHFGMLACNGKCDRLHLCQKRCAKLATSLDAWRPIWEAMDADKTVEGRARWENYYWQVSRLDCYILLATPMHHLTAAYNMIKGGK